MAGILKFFERLRDSMKLNGDEEDDEDYYDYEDEDYEEDGEDEGREGRGVFGVTRRGGEIEEEEKPRFFPPRKVTPVRRPAGFEVALVKPAVFDDAKEIVDDLLNGKAVVLNMEGINTEVAQRIIDFTCGAAYSMSGKLQKISNYIFIITPVNVNLSGEFQDLLGSSSQMDISGLNMRV